MKTPVSRRNLLVGTAALGTTGLLAACGGGKSNKPGALPLPILQMFSRV